MKVIYYIFLIKIQKEIKEEKKYNDKEIITYNY